MTREDIIRMAREAGFVPHFTRPQDAIVRNGYAISGELKGYKAGMLDIERFATLAAEWGAKQEREACAKFCEENQVFRGPKGSGFLPFHKETLGRHEGMDYAAAIRSRGEVKP